MKILATLVCGLSALLCALAVSLSASEVLPLRFSAPWFAAIGLNISFFIDHFTCYFLAVIAGISTAVFGFSRTYFNEDPYGRRTLLILTIFLIGMIGLVVADNLLLLFMFWEVTSITSFLLVGGKGEQLNARSAARQALLVTVFGGLALLVSFLMIFQITGTLELSEIDSHAEALTRSPLYLLVLVFFLLGAFTKSAQFPFHFWLPGAMTAPSPVSALLHSATMVKAGIYLIARFHPVLGGTPAWHTILMGAGAVTMLLAAALAVTKYDLKELLAYTTVSALGMLVFLFGLGTTLAFKAALVFLLVHACYKGALFLVAGIIEKRCRTRDLRKLWGLGSAMPVLWTITALSALAMCGLPPMLGFIGKELIYEAQLKAPSLGGVYLVIGFLTNAFTVVAALLIGLKPFSRPKSQKPTISPASTELLIYPLLLGLFGLLLGLFPTWTSETFLNPSFEALRGESSSFKAKHWHGINLVLLLSIATLAVGGLLYATRSPWRPLAAQFVDRVSLFRFQSIYEALVDGTFSLGRKCSALLQNGNLNFYLTIVLIFTSFMLLSTFLVSELSPPTRWHNFSPISAVLSAASIIAVVMVVRARSTMEAVVCLGVVGMSITVMFALLGAPDLALTQFMVELLLLVLLVAVSTRLPIFRGDTDTEEEIADLIASTVIGLSMGYFALEALTKNSTERVSAYFAENAFTEALGRNVVNVILVDFRALDTLGELLVLAVAVLGVGILLGKSKEGERL